LVRAERGVDHRPVDMTDLGRVEPFRTPQTVTTTSDLASRFATAVDYLPYLEAREPATAESHLDERATRRNGVNRGVVLPRVVRVGEINVNRRRRHRSP
jgi:hypothetical protein